MMIHFFAANMCAYSYRDLRTIRSLSAFLYHANGFHSVSGTGLLLCLWAERYTATPPAIYFQHLSPSQTRFEMPWSLKSTPQSPHLIESSFDSL